MNAIICHIPLTLVLAGLLSVVMLPNFGFAGENERVPFAGMSDRARNSQFSAQEADELRRTLPAHPYAWKLDKTSDGDNDSLPLEVRAYWDHYLLGSEAARRQLGAITTDSHRVAVHVFEPGTGNRSFRNNADQSTVLFLHGYLDHTAVNRYPIAELLQQGYSVVALDLPGHGLSSGPRGEIEDFSEYGMAVEAVVEAIRASQISGIPEDARLSAIAHSTGASALIEYLEQGGEQIERMVLAAPLVRIYAFPLARIGVQLTSDIIEALPRRISGSSSNTEYIDFVRDHDPLAIREASLEWSQAYLQWEAARREVGPYDMPVLLIQAGSDTVVDVDYNTRFLSQAFPKLEYAVYEEANHNIFNEPPGLRAGMYDRIHRFLRNR